MEVAEAMLRPLEDDVSQQDTSAWPAERSSSVRHPHQRTVRLERARRPGSVPAASAACTTPIAAVATSSPRSTTPSTLQRSQLAHRAGH